MTNVAAPKKVIAIIVMTAFIMVCVLAPFGAAHAIVGISTAAVTILIAGLAAIGITFASTGGFDTLNDYVENLLQEYASDNNIPVTSIFNGTQYSSNAAGKLLLNNRFVILIDTFAQWLIGKLNLVDNDSQSIVQAGASVDGMTVYNLPISFRVSTNNVHEWYVASGSSNVYCCFCYFNNITTSIAPVFFSENSFTLTRITIYQGNINSTNTYYSSSISNSSYYEYRGGSTDAQYFTDYETYYYFDLIDALQQDIPIDINNLGIGVETESINLPSDNLDYTSGDGAILDIGASWGETTGGAIATVPDIWPQWLPQTETITVNPDITIEYEAEAVLEDALPQPSDIENIPGATIPGLPDIGDGEPWHLEFSSLWHYVAQWISDMSAGGAVLWNVCIQAPPAIVNLVFAGIVLAMWFGAIKILR